MRPVLRKWAYFSALNGLLFAGNIVPPVVELCQSGWVYGYILQDLEHKFSNFREEKWLHLPGIYGMLDKRLIRQSAIVAGETG